MRSKYRPSSKGASRPPPGYRAPNDTDVTHGHVWNGPYHYYETVAKDGDDTAKVRGDFVAEFVAGTPGGKPYYEDMSHLRNAKKGLSVLDANGHETAPSWIVKLRQSGDAKLIEDALSETAYQFQRRVQWYTKAMELMQAIDTIETRFRTFRGENKDVPSTTITVELFGKRNHGEDMTTAARRRKPFVLVTRVRNEANTEWEPNQGMPQNIGKIIGIAKRAHSLPATTQMGTLVEVKRNTSGQGQTPGTTPPAALKAEIKTTNKLEEYVSAVANFLDQDGTYDETLAKCTSPADKGQLASAIVIASSKLARIAANVDVQRMSSLYLANAAKQEADSKGAPPVKTVVDPKTAQPVA